MKQHTRKWFTRSGIALLSLGMLLSTGALTQAASSSHSSASEAVLNVYGPGGPAPAMKEAALEFGKEHHVLVKITAGPTNQWMVSAMANADIIDSGAEYMMSGFVAQMPGLIDTSTITPLYLRPSAILVRPGNPLHIHDFPDLLKHGMHVLVVDGAGQAGLWEDMAGKQGNIQTVKAMRNNIAYYASSSADAKKEWIKDKSLNAWIIWNIWQKSNPTVASLVPVSSQFVIYRDCGVALTNRAKSNPIAKEFVSFLQSPQGAAIFAKLGWITN